MYPIRWELEHTYSILEEILKYENIWYTVNRDYDTAMRLTGIAYNLMVISNVKVGEEPKEKMKIVICLNMRHCKYIVVKFIVNVNKLKIHL